MTTDTLPISPPEEPPPSSSRSPTDHALLIPALSDQRDLVILYGSQSGCAAELAQRLSLDSFHRRFSTTVLPLDSFSLERLSSTPLLIIITSTQGNGDPPDNAKSFYRALLRRGLPPSALSSVQFSVFGLGDSGYPIYNAIARRVYQRMLDLGAVSVCRRGLGDDQDEHGYEDGWEEWRSDLWAALRERIAWLRDLPEESIDTSRRPPPKFSVSLEESDGHDDGEAPSSSPWCRVSAAEPLPPPSPAAVVLPPVSLPPFGQGASTFRAFPALLTHNVRLTPASHFQDVRHLRFALPSSAPTFRPGDVVDIVPRNDPAAVSSFLASLSLSPSILVLLTPTSDTAPALPPRCTLQELFEVHLDVQGTPKRSFFSFLALHASDPLQRDKLLEFCTKEGQAELWRYCHKEKRTYAEVLADFSSARPPLAELIAEIPRLAPRSFSIASSALLHPGEVEVTAALLAFTTPWKRRRTGVCSRFFSLLPQSEGDAPLSSVVYVPIHIRPGGFALPKSIGWGGPPVVMIGPGTGVAPLRALCQHKEALLSSTPSSSPTSFSRFLLIFGNRNRHADFLYEEEWARHHSLGVLSQSVITAFSRDQDEKVYVQDRLVEDAVRATVYDCLVTQNGFLLLSGSSGAMPREVRRALVSVFQLEGGMDESEAQDYLRRMEKERRYVQETW